MTGPSFVADAASVGPSGLRVVKVGGSLLAYDGLVPAFRQWLDRQPPLPTVLIAGGGDLVEIIRQADCRFGLGEEVSHWLCVSAMSVTARLLAALLPEAALVADGVGSLFRSTRMPMVNGLAEKDSRPLFVFDPEPFLREEEHMHFDPLPHTWNVTSDSIAARLAEVLGADELVLLKSASGASHPTREAAAAAGYVDPYFPRAVANVARVRWVNLRSATFEESLFV